MTDFAYLHAHSEYSLRDGCMSIDAYVQRLHEFGVETAALTDTHNLFGAFKFHQKALARGIKPVIGIDLKVRSGREGPWSRERSVRRMRVLVENRAGYRSLCQLLSQSYEQRRDRGLFVPLEELSEHREGLFFLGPPDSGGQRPPRGPSGEALRGRIERGKKWFGDRFFVEVPLYGPLTEANRRRLEEARRQDLQPLLTHPVYFLDPDDEELLRLRIAVQSNTSLDQLSSLPEHRSRQHLVSGKTLREWAGEETGPLEATAKLANRCYFEFRTGSIRMPAHPEAGEDPDQTLVRRCEERLNTVDLSTDDETAKRRLEKELSVISKTGFSDYFLIVADIIDWAREQGIGVGPGRGSSAGSLVSYLLGITRVDPFEYGLVFERFLNPQRNEMPDIDVDFADHRRDEVIEYIRRRHGEEAVAHIITFGQMKARNALRDVGRIRGEDQSAIDRLAEMIPTGGEDRPLSYWRDRIDGLEETLENSPGVSRWYRQASRLEGRVRNPSVHAAGILVGSGDLSREIPLYYPDERNPQPASQFDMYDVQKLGFLKLDILGLTTLTLIERTLQYLPEDERPDLSNLSDVDETTARLFREKSLEGVFQFESAGSRRLVREMQPTSRKDIVDCIALYRPGPLEMRDPYLRRRRGEEEVEYPHEDLKPILEDTHGLIIYQEQVMAIARKVAGFSWSQADHMRKAMGKKRADLMEDLKQKFLEGASENGYGTEWAKQLFETLSGFAEYGFNRSHSAAYGMITHQTAHLKAHHPVAFYAALLSVRSGNRDRIARIAEAMREDGVPLLPPDINDSGADFSVEDGAVRYGLRSVKNVGDSTARAVVDQRSQGPYEGIEDFAGRVSPDYLRVDVFRSLVAAGCFDTFSVDRGALIRRADTFVKRGARRFREEQRGQESMFSEPDPLDDSAPPPDDSDEWSEDRLRRAQREVLGYAPGRDSDPTALVIADFTYPGRVSRLVDRGGPSPLRGSPPQIVATPRRDGEASPGDELLVSDVESETRLRVAQGVTLPDSLPSRCLMELRFTDGVDEVIGLQELPDDLEGTGLEIHLTPRQGLDQIRRLRALLAEAPGSHPVRLVVHRGEELHRMHLEEGVRLLPELRSRLQSLLGPGHLRLFIADE